MAAAEPHPLEHARQLAVRCAIGLETSASFEPAQGASPNPRLVTSHVLKISPMLTPSLEECVATACANLSYPRQLIDAYVAPSLESNAWSSSHQGRCLVVLNSALVEALGPAELTFVIGHEIGHFLLPEASAGRPESLENSIKSRRAELTMDRIGLIASRDLNMACLAKLKMLSGLARRHLRLDLVEVISDWRRELEQGAHDMLLGSSHPPPGLRIHALVRFHGTDVYRKAVGLSGGADIGEVNRDTLGELHDYVESKEYHIIQSRLVDLSCALAGLAAGLGVTIRKSSLQGAGFDVPVESLRESVGNILSVPDSNDRVREAKEAWLQCLRLAYDAAPEATALYLGKLGTDEPSLMGRLREIGAGAGSP